MEAIGIAQHFCHINSNEEVCSCATCRILNGDPATQIVREERDFKNGRAPKILGKIIKDVDIDEPAQEYQTKNPGKTRIGCLLSLIRLLPAALYYITHTDRERGESER